MNLEEIRTEVEIKVEDPSFGPDIIDGYVNSCVKYVAALVTLPSLKRVSTVVTNPGQAWLTMSSVSNSEVFSGILRKVKKADANFPAVYPDIERLMEDYDMVSAGEVVAVTLEGNILWYANIPEDPETLTVLFTVNPSQLRMNEDIPVDIPEHLHRKLLVHGTCNMIFDDIEDKSELEGQKVKTAEHFWQSFDGRNPDSGISKLHEWLARTRPHHISSVWNY